MQFNNLVLALRKELVPSQHCLATTSYYSIADVLENITNNFEVDRSLLFFHYFGHKKYLPISPTSPTVYLSTSFNIFLFYAILKHTGVSIFYAKNYLHGGYS